MWENILDEIDGLAISVGFVYKNSKDDLTTPYWEDVFDEDMFDIDELYSNAIKMGGDRFVWFKDNGYISIIALRGDAGAPNIEYCVSEEANTVVTAGSTDWPDELCANAAIASLSVQIHPSGIVKLRDGFTIIVE